MIRVNLLPTRAAKKKETAIQQIVIAVASILLVAVAVASLYVYKKIQITAAKADISVAENKIKELKTKIGKLEELKTLKEQVKKKLDVLAQLRKNKTGPAQRLASLSDHTPERLWLTGYSESPQGIKLSGVALNEELIAEFMRSLEATKDFITVELVVSEQTEISGTKLKKFDISMKLETAGALTEQAKAVPVKK